jgi:SAM-dependent methyltransferase
MFDSPSVYREYTGRSRFPTCAEWSAVDERTRQYYSSRGREVADGQGMAGEGIARHFRLAFRRGARVLDLGCGEGWDTARLLRDGYESYGVEPVPELREIAIERHPELAGRLFSGSLPDDMPDPENARGPFDGIVCSAVLQHLPRSALFDAIFALKPYLVPRGRLLVSIPLVGPETDEDGRDEHGRLFSGVSPGEFELLVERAGFASLGRWDDDDALGRSGRRWSTMLFELRSGGPSRPLDRIDGVLRNDRKVATYKLALMRALAEIATTRPHVGVWRPDGRIGIPIGVIAECWVRYYWPFFERGAPFVPQMNGERGRDSRCVAFAAPLALLTRHYAESGRLSRYLLDCKGGALSGEAKAMNRKLMAKLRDTIRAGPVTYAGGSLESGRMFGYEDGQVLVAADLWRELALMGHWIRDSLILRWAEMCSRLSRNEVSREMVIQILLREPDAKREMAAARKVYDALPDKVCVWSDRRLLRDRFEVDHAIPFSLWRNNDLWNLLPTARTVNSRKRDRLPTRPLVRRRRDVILDYWQATRQAFPRRFESESLILTGHDESTLGHLFDVFSECLEVTALQRGCERWEP